MIRMIINLAEQLVGFDRYNGGWVKTIERIYKDYNNGYSLVGEFIANKQVKNVNLEEDVLYLDCSIGGSRKNQEKSYHLFKLEDGEIEIIQTIENGQDDWAVQLWDSIENELELENTEKVDNTLRKIKKLSDSEFFDMMEKLRTDKRYQIVQYHILEDFLKSLVNEGTLEETIEEVKNKM